MEGLCRLHEANYTEAGKHKLDPHAAKRAGVSCTPGFITGSCTNVSYDFYSAERTNLPQREPYKLLEKKKKKKMKMTSRLQVL